MLRGRFSSPIDPHRTFRNAAGIGKMETLVTLQCEQYIDINSQSEEEGITALHRASMNGQFEIVEYLIEQNADLHIIDKKGNTALHHAVLSLAKRKRYDLFLQLITLLLYHGGNPLVSNQENETPFTLLGKVKSLKEIRSDETRVLAYQAIIEGIKTYVLEEAKKRKQNAKITSEGQVIFINKDSATLSP
jgi:hypothetical protein